MKITILGGGVTGLACALHLQKISRKKSVPMELQILEASSRLGGMIHSEERGGCLFEAGPDSLFAEESWVLPYVEDLGLKESLIYTSKNNRESFIYLDGKFVPLSRGLQGSAAAEILPFLWNARSQEFSGLRYSQFVSFQGGMEELVSAMGARVPAAGVRLNTGVESLEARPDSFEVRGENFETQAEGVCIALPARPAGALLSSLNPGLAKKIGEVPHRRAASVHLIYESGEKLPEGFGFVVPRSQNRTLSGCTFVSRKFPGRSPQGREVLRVFLSQRSLPGFDQATDEDILKAARKEIEEILGIRGRPLDHRIHRFEVPEYREGHAQTERALKLEAGRFPGLSLAGNFISGAGIPACIKSGEAAAESLCDYLIGRKMPKQEV